MTSPSSPSPSPSSPSSPSPTPTPTPTSSSMIPKKIFQTHKSMDYIRSKPTINNAVKSWRRFSHEFEYHFFSDIDCELFMKNVMGGNIYIAYMRLPMAVMKADLWRYCVIYTHGGIYADTDTICKVNPSFIFSNDKAYLICAPENSTHLCQWVFAAPPKSPILFTIIQESVKRILEIPKIKGEHIIHHLTGPAVFTDAIEIYLKKHGHKVFKNKLEYSHRYPFLAVFKHKIFHSFMVNHLYAGQHRDGWIRERNKLLM